MGKRRQSDSTRNRALTINQKRALEDQWQSRMGKPKKPVPQDSGAYHELLKKFKAVA